MKSGKCTFYLNLKRSQATITLPLNVATDSSWPFAHGEKLKVTIADGDCAIIIRRNV